MNVPRMRRDKEVLCRAPPRFLTDCPPSQTKRRALLYRVAHRDRHRSYSAGQRMASIATYGSSPHWNAARVGRGSRLCVWQPVQWLGLRHECAGPDRAGDESRSTSRLARIRVDARYRCGDDRVWVGSIHTSSKDMVQRALLYASPVGLVPCPTLAVAIGFALLGNGLGPRVWSLTLGSARAVLRPVTACCVSA